MADENHCHTQFFSVKDLATHSVTIYPTGATVVRDIEGINIKPGRNEIIIKDITSYVDEHSIKVEGRGIPGSALITGMTMKLSRIENSDIDDISSSSSEDGEDEGSDWPEDLKYADRKLKALNLELDAFKDDEWSITSQQSFLTAAVNSAMSSTAVMGKFMDEGILRILSMYDSKRKELFDSRVTIRQYIAGVEKNIRHWRRQKKKLQRALSAKKKTERAEAAELRAAREMNKQLRQTQGHRVCVTIERDSLPKAMPLIAAVAATGKPPNVLNNDDSPACPSLRLSYVVPNNIGWVPRYDISLDTTLHSGMLTYCAYFSNSTGETWRDTLVTLSTSQNKFSGLNDTMPTLNPWHIGLQNQPNVPMWRSSWGLLSPQEAEILQSAQPQQPRSLFGSSAQSAQPQQSGGLFGSRVQSGGLFGSSAQSAQPQQSGLFGLGAQSAQPQQSGGLFGSNVQSAQPQQSGGLFGSSAQSAQPQQSGGLFGSSVRSAQPQQSGSLFGSRVQSGGLFESSAQSAQPQQSGGLFGSGAQSAQPQQSGGLFGSGAQSAQPQQSGSLFGSRAPLLPLLQVQTQAQQPSGSLFGLPAYTTVVPPSFSPSSKDGEERRNTEAFQPQRRGPSPGNAPSEGGDSYDSDVSDTTMVDRSSLRIASSTSNSYGMTTTYTLPGRLTIGASQLTHRHVLLELPLEKVKFSHSAVPKLRKTVFFQAEILNDSTTTFLGGVAGVTVDGSFCGNTTISKSCFPGDTLTVRLGIDESIQIKYSKPRQMAKTGGGHGLLMKSEREQMVTYARSIMIHNSRPRPVKLVVHDQIPVSEEEKLKVTVLRPKGLTLPGDGEKQSKATDGKTGAKALLRKDGEIVWELEVDSGKDVRLGLEYEVSYPDGKMVVNSSREGRA